MLAHRRASRLGWDGDRGDHPARVPYLLPCASQRSLRRGKLAWTRRPAGIGLHRQDGRGCSRGWLGSGVPISSGWRSWTRGGRQLRLQVPLVDENEPMRESWRSWGESLSGRQTGLICLSLAWCAVLAPLAAHTWDRRVDARLEHQIQSSWDLMGVMVDVSSQGVFIPDFEYEQRQLLEFIFDLRQQRRVHRDMRRFVLFASWAFSLLIGPGLVGSLLWVRSGRTRTNGRNGE